MFVQWQTKLPISESSTATSLTQSLSEHLVPWNNLHQKCQMFCFGKRFENHSFPWIILLCIAVSSSTSVVCRNSLRPHLLSSSIIFCFWANGQSVVASDPDWENRPGNLDDAAAEGQTRTRSSSTDPRHLEVAWRLMQTLNSCRISLVLVPCYAWIFRKSTLTTPNFVNSSTVKFKARLVEVLRTFLQRAVSTSRLCWHKELCGDQSSPVQTQSYKHAKMVKGFLTRWKKWARNYPGKWKWTIFAAACFPIGVLLLLLIEWLNVSRVFFTSLLPAFFVCVQNKAHHYWHWWLAWLWRILCHND